MEIWGRFHAAENKIDCNRRSFRKKVFFMANAERAWSEGGKRLGNRRSLNGMKKIRSH